MPAGAIHKWEEEPSHGGLDTPYEIMGVHIDGISVSQADYHRGHDIEHPLLITCPEANLLSQSIFLAIPLSKFFHIYGGGIQAARVTGYRTYVRNYNCLLYTSPSPRD